MNPSPAPSSYIFRYFAIGVVCVAVLLGGYFVRLNAQVDRERAEVVERLALCRQVERVAGEAASNSAELRETCRQFNGQSSNSVTSH
ncbi:hypothetical protein B7453_27700 [Pseudomonas sp. IB20]|uniref:hypothetical protein n=1 Tax=Pseudomonas sp. AU10 TaxID=882697 RepID=UPI000B9FA067|nr:MULTISPECIES: hypothetical protein [unclassified Pseudomonas]MCV2230347.1 hypothetical protein [Pseudomonas sp. AU10]OZO01290.1 hypothetical protein B7453_27700 [Pseudomonas sp. IB20]